MARFWPKHRKGGEKPRLRSWDDHAPAFEVLERRIMLSADGGAVSSGSLVDPYRIDDGQTAIYMDLTPGLVTEQEPSPLQSESTPSPEALPVPIVLPETHDDEQNADAAPVALTPGEGTPGDPGDTASVAANTAVHLPSLQLVVSAQEIQTINPAAAGQAEDTSSSRVPVPEGDTNLGQTAGEAIQIRGPPEGLSQASDSSVATANGDSSTDSVASSRSAGALPPVVPPVLPGLQLVDPKIGRWQGQTIYLDFDGAKGVVYNGPVTVGPFDVPAFKTPL